MKKFKFSILTLVLGAIFSLGLFGFSNNKPVYADAAAAEPNSYYLLNADGTGTYKANQAVGTTEGYGKYTLGQPASLTTSAIKGFKVVGWNVYLKDQDDTLFIDGSDITDDKYTFTTLESETVASTITFTDTNSDGVYDSSKFELARVFEDMEIEPVFDHVYYNLEITNIAKVIKLLETNKLSLGSGIYAYYNERTVDGAVQTLTGVILENASKYYYVGDVTVQGFNPCKQFTRLDADSTNEYVNILSNNGAFRLNDIVELNLDIDINSADIYSSKNIDVQGVKFNSNALTKVSDGLGVNNYQITQDTYKRTTAVDVKVKIEEKTTLTNDLTLDLHGLYIIKIDRKIDGATPVDYNANLYENATVGGSVYEKLYELDSEYFYINENNVRVPVSLTQEEIDALPTATTHTFNDAKDLLKIKSYNNGGGLITVYNEYAMVSEDVYLVKDSASNNGRSFSISCEKNYEEVSLGARYQYYSFGYLINSDGQESTDRTEDYGGLSYNFTVIVNYTTVNYNVNFVSTIKQADETLKPAELQVLEDVAVKHGTSATINSAPTNTGYSFVGYATSLTSEAVPTSIDVAINHINPRNKTIYLVYEYVNYTLNIVGVEKTIGTNYSIKNFTINRIRGLDVITQNIDLEDIEYSEFLNINDQVKLNYSVNNNGFIFYGFAFNSGLNVEESGDELFKEFTLNEELIESLGAGNTTITLYAYEDYKYFTLTYQINKTKDDSTGEELLMAEISAALPAGADKEEFVETDYKKIMISNLKYNDVVTLNSAAKLQEGTTTYYMFIKFTADDITGLSYTVLDNVHSHVETITENRTITVVYSTPKSTIIISVNNTKAYDNLHENVSVTSAGNSAEFDESISSYVVAANSAIEVELTGDVVFGYKYVGYTLDGAITKVTAQNNIVINFQSNNGVQNLIINFETIKYHFVIEQYGYNFNGEKYNFGTAASPVEYTVLDVESLTLSFNKPIGYYVDSVKCGDTEIGSTFNLVENNDGRNSASVNYSQEIVNFATLVGTYNSGIVDNVQTINLKVNYTTYLYEITVGYIVDNIYKIELPIFNVSEQVEKTQYNDDFKSIVYSNIPYGTTFTLSVDPGQTLNIVEFTEWLQVAGAAASYNSSETLSFNSVTADSSYRYVLNFIQYQIYLDYNSSHGVANSNVDSITHLAELTISAEAKIEAGYLFKHITYKYKYIDESSWQEVWDSLYVLDNGEYALNKSEEYNSLITYYVFAESAPLNIDEFNVNQYVIETGNRIEFYIGFKALEFKIQNISNEISDFIIEAKNFAEYTAEAERNGVTREINSGSTLTVDDVLTITIQINNYAVGKDGNTYKLINGILLTGCNYGVVSQNKDDMGNPILGGYIFKLAVRSKISNIVNALRETNTDIITIIYAYELKNYNVYVNTSIGDVQTFYKGISLEWTDGSNQRRTQGGDDSTGNGNYEQPFLSEETVRINFTQNNDGMELSSWFDVKAFKISNGVNELTVAKEDYEALADQLKEEFGVFKIDYEIGNSESYKKVQTQIIFKLQSNITITFIAIPKIYFDGNEVSVGSSHKFIKEFSCENTTDGINPLVNRLTINNAGNKSDNISIPSAIDVEQLEITYYEIKKDGSVSSNPIAEDEGPMFVGQYKVNISFKNEGANNWLSVINLNTYVVLEIVPMKVQVKAQEVAKKYTKEYDGGPSLTGANITLVELLTLVDVVDARNNIIKLELSGDTLQLSARITNTITDGEIAVSVVGSNYNIQLNKLSLSSAEINNNFILVDNDGNEIKSANVIFYNIIDIVRRVLTLNLGNATILDKVYDGNVAAQFSNNSTVSLNGVVDGDDIGVNMRRIILNFNNAEVGEDKTVSIDPAAALTGTSIGNYTISTSTESGFTIYPYSLTHNVAGLGDVSLYNRKGLEDPTKANLIALGSQLLVEPIYVDTGAYAEIYSSIESFLSRRNVFAIGYKISLEVYGEKRDISNELFLSVPNVEKQANVLFITGENMVELPYETQGNYTVVDLSKLQFNLNTVAITQRQALLQTWQIVLIVVGSVVIIGGTAAVVVILRIRKKRSYDRFDTI